VSVFNRFSLKTHLCKRIQWERIEDVTEREVVINVVKVETFENRDLSLTYRRQTRTNTEISSIQFGFPSISKQTENGGFRKRCS